MDNILRFDKQKTSRGIILMNCEGSAVALFYGRTF